MESCVSSLATPIWILLFLSGSGIPAQEMASQFGKDLRTEKRYLISILYASWLWFGLELAS